jgi:site-specific recombinase XerD
VTQLSTRCCIAGGGPVVVLEKHADSLRDFRGDTIHPSTLELTQYLSALATQSNVPASTQNQALSALLFLYRDVLGREVPRLDDVVRAKRTTRLPVVLAREEVRAGLRQLECARLRVKDIDFSAARRAQGSDTERRCSRTAA